MKTSRSKISKVIADQLENGASEDSVARSTAAYLMSEKRIHELNSVIRDIQAYWAEDGYVNVTARVAHVLPADALEAIRGEISKHFPDSKQIIVTQVVDPTVIGGIRLELPNKLLDMSVRAKLNRFKQATIA